MLRDCIMEEQKTIVLNNADLICIQETWHDNYKNNMKDPNIFKITIL
jgi:hypothetical protein